LNLPCGEAVQEEVRSDEVNGSILRPVAGRGRGLPEAGIGPLDADAGGVLTSAAEE
jgi:hypothetical protein